MEKQLFSNLNISLAIFFVLFVFVVIYALLTIRKAKDKPIWFLKLCVLLWLVICVSFSDYSKLFKYDSVESAYHFGYPKGEIIYKKRFKNLVFTYGIESYKPGTTYIFPSIFALFVEEENKWEIQHIGDAENRKCITDKKMIKYIQYICYLLMMKKQQEYLFLMISIVGH